jgi:ribonuclease HI
MTITAAADGSALGNPGPAGWAWYIDDDTWRAGGWPHGTNNMGELKAVLDLLESTAAAGLADEDLLVLCDSQYVINSVTKWMAGWKRKGWKKRDGKPVLNVELMKALDAALQGRQVRFEWVKGHAGHAMNEAADHRANAAATAFQKKQTPQEGPGFSGAGAPAAAASSPAVAPAASATSATSAASATDGVTDSSTGSDTDAAVSRELALLSDVVRGDRDLAGRLLHPAMTETGVSGRRYTRDEVLDVLSPLVGFDAVDEVCAADITAERIAPAVILLTYTTSGASGTVHRSSLWVRDGESWLLRHHQATPEQ